MNTTKNKNACFPKPHNSQELTSRQTSEVAWQSKINKLYRRKPLQASDA